MVVLGEWRRKISTRFSFASLVGNDESRKTAWRGESLAISVATSSETSSAKQAISPDGAEL